MRIESLVPLRLRLPEGEIRDMLPGQSIDLPEPLAQKLLAKIPGKVRLVSNDIRPGVWIGWLSPALPACQAEVMAVHPGEVVEVFHPLTETLCRIPIKWITHIIENPPTRNGKVDANG